MAIFGNSSWTIRRAKQTKSAGNDNATRNGGTGKDLSLDRLIKTKETTCDPDKLDLMKLRRLRMALRK